MTPVSNDVTWEAFLGARHLDVLVDDVGILQHAAGTAPTVAHGYCVDDVARLLIVAAGLHRRDPTRYGPWRMMNRALSFLTDAEGGGGMRNFMSFDRQWLDEPHAGDHVGRTVWALGEVVQKFPHVDSLFVPAHALLERLLPRLEHQDTVHEWAYTLLGLSRASPTLWEPRHIALAHRGCRFMVESRSRQEDNWPWFANRLTYDNARLAQSLIAMGPRLGEQDITLAGLDALEWLWGMCDRGTHVSTVGNTWLAPGQDPLKHTGDEQPIDAGATVEACVEASWVVQGDAWSRRAQLAFSWFLGRNRLGVPLFDAFSGGCRDGLGVSAVNNNQGAESTLAFLQAGLAQEGAGINVPGVHHDYQLVDAITPQSDPRS